MVEKLSSSQRETLEFMAAHRCRHGVYTMDRREEATTFASLRRRKLIGYYTLPRIWIATKYKITPAGRAALASRDGGSHG